MSGGRPTSYKEEYNEQAYKLCLMGHTDKELASFFEVNEDTIHEWKKKHPKFSESIKSGKQIADGNVTESLYKRAMGYEHEDVDIKVIDGQIVKTPLVKHYPPDATSMIFWLKNRQRAQWRDKQDIEHTGKDGKDLFNNMSDEELEAKIKQLSKK
jgi:cell fate (sporulation/competence/biofilm development) regulator YmcA (YheA/YmcA/DUF963 family)